MAKNKKYTTISVIGLSDKELVLTLKFALSYEDAKVKIKKNKTNKRISEKVVRISRLELKPNISEIEIMEVICEDGSHEWTSPVFIDKRCGIKYIARNNQ